MKATSQKPTLQFRQGLFHFILSSKALLAAFLLLFSFATKANDNPYFASKDYFHWADLLNTWDNGNLSKNKSGYKEGDVVAHSYVPNGLITGTEYTALLKYDYYLSTKDAGGFSELVWDPAQFSKSPNGQQGEGALTGTNKTLGSISYFATNLELTSVTPMADQTSGNTTLKVWEIKFIYKGTTGADAALYFGLKLAVKDEVNAPSNGSAAWSGASLQTYLDPSSDPGTRSLQIDPGAIQSACTTPPTVTAGSYGPLCSNASPILLSGSPSGGTWTGTGVSGDATNGFYFDPSVGTQTLIYTFTDGNGCSNSDETTITVNQAPTVTAGSYGPLCSNVSPISLVGDPAGGVWSGTGVSGSQANGYTFDPSVGTQTLTYSYTDGNGCSGTAQTTISVNQAPTVSAGSYGPLCSSGSAILLGGTPTGGTWTGTGVSGDATNGYYFDPSVGTQTLTYSYTDGNGCSGTAQTTISVNAPPTCSITQAVPASGNPQVGQVASFSAPAGYNYAWTISSIGNTANASIVNNTASSQTVQVSTTMAGSYTLQLTLTDAETGCSSTCSKPVTVNPSSPYTTYTKGFWGTAGGAFCGSSGSNKMEVLSFMATAVGASQTFGSTKKFTLLASAFTNTGTLTKPNAQIFKLLPGGSTPSVLTCDGATSTPTIGWGCVPIDANPKSSTYGSILNNLLAQGIAMFFNMKKDLNLGSAILYGNKLTFTAYGTCATGSTTQTIPICVYNAAIDGSGIVTVAGIYNIAMKVLGGEITNISASNANAALNALNVGFDKGKQITGVAMDNTSCATMTVTKPSNSTIDMEVKILGVSAYPNPFTDHIRFTIQSPKAGRATLEVYNMLGQKVGVPFEGQLNAGETRSVDYTAPVNHRSNLIYLLRMNGEQASGKLMSTKQ